MHMMSHAHDVPYPPVLSSLHQCGIHDSSPSQCSARADMRSGKIVAS